MRTLVRLARAAVADVLAIPVRLTVLLLEEVATIHRPEPITDAVPGLCYCWVCGVTMGPCRMYVQIQDRLAALRERVR